MAEDITRMVAVMEANLVAFTKGMEQAQQIADKKFAAIERRMRQTESTFSKGFSTIGTSLLGGAAFVGIERFVSSSVALAQQLKNTSANIGITTDQLQEFAGVAAKAGVNQEELTAALERFSKNVGDAQIKGGAFKTMLDGLGVGTTGSIGELFLKYADAVAATGNQQQRTALITAAFGRTSAGLAGFVQQGSAAIRAQGEELKNMGAILQKDAIDKLTGLGTKWDELKKQLQVTGASALSGFADEFSQFAEELEKPEFRQSLHDFVTLMADVAAVLAKLHTFWPEIVGGIAGLAVGGPFGGLIGVGVGAFAAGVDNLYQIFKGKTAATPGGTIPIPKPPVGNLDRSGLLQKQEGDKAAAAAAAAAAKAALDVVKAINAANVELTKGSLAAYGAIRRQIDDNAAAELFAIDEERKAKIAALDQEKTVHAEYIKAVNSLNDEAASKETAVIIDQRSQRAQNLREEIEARRQLNAGLDQARREEIRSQHDAILEQVQGTEDYYKVARELSDEDAKLEKERITDELNHDLDIMDRRKQEIEAAGGLYADYENERKIATEKANLAIQGADNAAAARRMQLTEAETHAIHDQVQLMDQVRDGLEGLGDAALNGSKGFGAAVADMLRQLALLALKLYIMKPLVESVLGPGGTIGGGLLGSLLGLGGPAAVPASNVPFAGHGFTGFRDGGVMTSRGRLPLRRYAGGGVANAPQLAMFGEGSRAEAYVPLPDGRSIPVSLNLPQIQPSSRAGQAIINIDARGAQAGVAEQIDAAMQSWAPKIVGTSVSIVKRNMAPMMAEASKRSF